MKNQHRQVGMPALDLAEEAIHLLRLAPPGVLLTYYLGAAPFAIGFLYFWSDMSRSAFAVERCAPFAAILALLFIWMKSCQMWFARRLREQAEGKPLEPLNAREWLSRIVAQTFLQATGFLVLPIGLVLTVPAAWCLAFYQNATVMGALELRAGKSGFQQLIAQTRLWVAQNHILLVVVFLFGSMVLVNVVSVFLAGPFMLKTFLGIETAASQSWWAMLNTTFIAAALVVTWLCVDPIVKAIYVLRCFYGQSISDGADLRAELRAVRRRRRVAVIGAFVMLIGIGAELPAAMDSPDESMGSSELVVGSTELDEAIDETLQKREFAWRMPRGDLPEMAASENWLSDMVNRSLEWFGTRLKALFKSVFEFVRWLFEKLFDTDRSQGAPGGGWLNAVRGLFILVICGLVGVLGYLLWRLWINHRKRAPATVGEAALPVPDLEDDRVSATDLPENEWLRLARDLVSRREYRLALRAYYLAGLANLAERGLIAIERYKSNRDYELELNRRSHALPELVTAFSMNVLVFDRVWYGRHEVTTGLLDQFEGNLRRICGA